MPVERPTLPDLSTLRIDESARKSGGSRWLRWFAVAVGVLVLVSGAVLALRGKVPVVELASAHAPTESREVLLNASGYVTPRRRATIAAKITGQVTNVYIEEGVRVKEGQVLATLDESDARVRLNSAQADRDSAAAALQDLQVQWENADRELRRTQALQRGGVSSQQALDLARTTADSLKAKIALTRQQIQAAEARIRIAQQDLANCVVRSPFDGIVVSKDAQVGEMVSPISAGGGFTRTGIATVVDMNSNEIEVDVSESYISRVKDGQPVTAILDAYPDWEIPSKVRTIIPSADRQKATVKVRISFIKLDPRILPDMGVKVTFYGEDEDKKAAAKKKNQGPKPVAIIAKAAVRASGDSTYVLLLKNGKVE